MKVTSEQMQQALRDAGLTAAAGADSRVRAFERFICGEFLESVAADLDSPVTLENIFSVKAKYMQGWMNLQADPECGRSEEEAAGFAQRGPAAIEEFRSLTTELVSVYAGKGGSERLVFEMMGLSAENLAKAERGDLTIGELLVTQPTMILEDAS